MAYHTVEVRVGLYRKNYETIVDIPDGTQDIQTFVRQAGKITVSNTLHVERCELVPGTYYPRMARPMLINNSYIGKPGHGPLYIYGENMTYTLPHDKVALANSVNQLSILIRELKAIMEYMHPSTTNMNSFGHHTRNVLLLASMDFENECRGLLQAHGYISGSSRFNTNDYVKVAQPSRLSEYEVGLRHYPSLDPVRPFATWNQNSPTQTIPWYNNYNHCKHDREANFHLGNLESAINAICAVAIMLTAQYRIIESWRDQIGEFFSFRKHPQWNVWQRVIPSSSGWQALTHAF